VGNACEDDIAAFGRFFGAQCFKVQGINALQMRMNQAYGLSRQLAGSDRGNLDFGMVCEETQKLPTGVARSTDNSYIYHNIPDELMI
jgi:hypothetical protein